MMEQTLIVFKPDAVQRGLVGEILSRFEKAGLSIVASKMISPDEKYLHKHYEEIGKMITRRGQKAFDMTIKYLQESPVIAMVLEGVEAVSLVRKLVGPTEPKTALPGTIRGDYAHVSFPYADTQEMAVANLMHASGTEEEAKLEIAHWFPGNEIFSYEMSHSNYTRKPFKK